MIPFSSALTNTPHWQRQLADSFRSPRQLLRHLRLEAHWHPGLERAAQDFPLRVTRHFAELMEPGNPEDPLLLQVLPSLRERETAPGFVRDPTGDRRARSGPGLLRKYHGRALIIATGSCAIHCRYCFRRHFPYREQRADRRHREALFDTLAGDPTLTEVILSGGDPLMLGNDRLDELVERIGRLPRVRRLRIHSRLPVVLPGRLDAGLTELLTRSRLACTLVLHVNHPAELATSLARALRPLREGGIQLLNQSVLLRGINDDLEIQASLCEKLFDFGILPYYLHQMDKVAGGAHFEVPAHRARELHRKMRNLLPGYLLPRLVVEKAGAPAKLPL